MIPGQPELHRETLSQRTKKKRKTTFWNWWSFFSWDDTVKIHHIPARNDLVKLISTYNKTILIKTENRCGRTHLIPPLRQEEKVKHWSRNLMELSYTPPLHCLFLSALSLVYSPAAIMVTSWLLTISAGSLTFTCLLNALSLEKLSAKPGLSSSLY